MYVVIDTGAINLDFDLKNANTILLLAGATAAGLEVCVPEVVLREMVAHYRSELKKHAGGLENAHINLQRLLRRELETVFGSGDVAIAVERYDARLRAHLADGRVRILPMPPAASDVSILLERDFAKRKPFNSRGGGMRDAILWESVLELCRGGTRPLALITPNTNDFADESGELLHPDLLDELRAIGLPRESAELHKSIEAFIANRLGRGGNGAGAPPERDPSMPEHPPSPHGFSGQEERPTGKQVTETELQEAVEVEPPEFTPEDQLVLENHISPTRKADFLRSFNNDRQETRATELLFKRAGAFQVQPVATALPELTAGFNILTFKGPFVEGSNWLSSPTWEFAVSLEYHLLGRLERALRDATLDRTGQPVTRHAESVIAAADELTAELSGVGYKPSLIVLAGELGMQLHVDLEKVIVADWRPEVREMIGTTFRVLGLHRGIPILDIPASSDPSLYVVDLHRFAFLRRFGEQPDFALEEFDEENARRLLADHPRLIANPTAASGMDQERLQQMRLRVGLRLYETYKLQVNEPRAAIACPLIGPIAD